MFNLLSRLHMLQTMMEMESCLATLRFILITKNVNRKITVTKTKEVCIKFMLV